MHAHLRGLGCDPRTAGEGTGCEHFCELSGDDGGKRWHSRELRTGEIIVAHVTHYAYPRGYDPCFARSGRFVREADSSVSDYRPERLASSALTQAVLISERHSTDVIPNVLPS